jgi:poly-gamma-glutamate capsule biosynthesis protein CapA/YwtB (metallophosphatase superfamily)
MSADRACDARVHLFGRAAVDAGVPRARAAGRGRPGVALVHGHSSHHPKGVGVHRGSPILYGCGDFLTDYEGIGGHEELRPGLSLLYLVSFAAADPARLAIHRFRLRRFRLQEATGEEADWLHETLDRESRPLGARVRAGDQGTPHSRPITGRTGRLSSARGRISREGSNW